MLLYEYIITAVSPDDYSALVSKQLTFTSGQSSNSADNTQCFHIPIVYDNINEDTEMFTVHLTSSTDAVSIDSASASVTVDIINTDRKFTLFNLNYSFLSFSRLIFFIFFPIHVHQKSY